MAERIHLTGFRHDAPEIIAACKILVLPSVRDGFPRVILESMGYGVSPIVTNSGGCSEIVENGKNGFVIPVKDPKAIAESILRLYGDRELITEMSAECRNKIENEMSSRVTVDKYLVFFESLLNNTET